MKDPVRRVFQIEGEWVSGHPFPFFALTALIPPFPPSALPPFSSATDQYCHLKVTIVGTCSHENEEIHIAGFAANPCGTTGRKKF